MKLILSNVMHSTAFARADILACSAVSASSITSYWALCCLAVVFLLLPGASAQGATTDAWINTAGSAWLSGTNWSNASQPGVNDIAEFDADPTSNPNNFGIAFGGATNNGATNEAVGAIYLRTTRTNALTIGATSNTSGTFTLNGAAIADPFNSDITGANTILANYNTGTNGKKLELTGQNATGTGIMTVALGNVTNVVQCAAGTSNAAANTVQILTNITQVSTGSGIAFYGNGTSTTVGGTLELGGTNDIFTGGITIGTTDGQQGGLVQIDNPISGGNAGGLPTTGSIVVNPFSGLFLTTTGAASYGSAGQSLTINGIGAATPAGGGTSGALRMTNTGGTSTWLGNVTLGSDSVISVTGSSAVGKLNGSATDNGFQLQKQGSGVLKLSSSSNSLTGSTLVGNGTIQVDSGSSLGFGPLTLGQTSTNATAVSLNNATQTVGTLSSTWTALTGTLLQNLNLNGTALTINQTADAAFGVGAVPTLTSTITGSGSIALSSSSTHALNLTGTNTYTGTTTVNGGTLLVNGSLASQSAVTVGGSSAGGTPTVGGSGTIFGNLTVAAANGGVAGTVRPGTGLGTLTVGGNLSIGGTYAWDFDNAGSVGTAGTDYGQIAMTGASATTSFSGGTLNVALTSGNYSSSFWSSSQSWTIISTANTNNPNFSFSSITASGATGGSFSTALGSGASAGDVFLNWTPTPSTTAILDNSNSVSTFGTALTSTVSHSDGSAGSGSYAGVFTQVGGVSPPTGPGTGSPAFGSTGTVTIDSQFANGNSSLTETATILAGQNLTANGKGTATVSMAWRSRVAPNETTGGAGTTVPSDTTGLISDIVNLTGLTNAAEVSGEVNSTDPFVFQMTYNPNLLPKANHGLNVEESAIANSLLYLASLDPANGLWEPAIAENTLNKGINSSLAPGGEFDGSFAQFVADHNDDIFHLGTDPTEIDFSQITSTELAEVMGAYGADPATHFAWAVVDHNSDFAVVPEPSTLVLAAFGVLGGIMALRRRRTA